MSSNDTYVPKHRGKPAEPALKKGLKKSFVFSGVAVAATGLAVSSGVALKGAKPDAAAAALAAADAHNAASNAASAGSSTGSEHVSADRAARTTQVSRSDRRTAVDATKAQLLSQSPGDAVTKTEDLGGGDPKTIAQAMLAEFGWSSDQFGCLDSLWTRESGWRTTADNASSSAYGIPQALPGSKMASAGPDWEYNPETQIRWGLGYIKSSYGSPCGAWGHSQAHGWY